MIGLISAMNMANDPNSPLYKRVVGDYMTRKVALETKNKTLQLPSEEKEEYCPF